MKSATTKPPVIFILSSPCAGSAVLGSILAQHPQLFIPPELYLLPFHTLPERDLALAETDTFWRESPIRAIEQAKLCSFAQAQSLLHQFEAQNLTITQFYHHLQQWLDDKILVDQTINYASELDILKRAETTVEKPYYISLTRHPCGMMRLFETLKFEQFSAWPGLNQRNQDYSRRELAELIWLISYTNILDHFAAIPEDRRLQIRYEDLVCHPQTEIERVCQFLNLAFLTVPLPLEANKIQTPHALPQREFQAEAATAWQKYYTANLLGGMTCHVAELLGYAF